MHQPKKKLDPARDSSSIQSKPTSGNFPSPASIRRRYGTGWPGYEAAKQAWLDAYPAAGRADRDSAMRRIARAVRV